MRKSLSVCLMFSLFFISTACKKDDVTNPIIDIDSGPTIQLDKAIGYPGEALTVETYMNLNADSYTGSISSSDIQLIKAGKSLSFVVPEVAAGSYTLNLNIDGTDYSFDLQILEPVVVSNPDQYLIDYIIQNDAIIIANNAFMDSLVANGDADPIVTANDAAIWTNINLQAQAAIAAMTPSEKLKLAKILEANKVWIDAIPVHASNNYFQLKSQECDDIKTAGVDAINAGNNFTAMGLAVEYKWCLVMDHIDAKLDNTLSKAATLWEATENSNFLITLTNLVGNKIKALGDEVGHTGTDEFVGDQIVDYDEKSNLAWANGEIKNVFANVRFRSINAGDMNKSGTLGDFAKTFNSFISAYSDYVTHINEALIWRPEFMNKSKVVPFDRFLSIDNVDNDNVILLNTQTVDDNWQVIFATDAYGTQQFWFDLVYNDGHVRVSWPFYATVQGNDLIQDRLDAGETPLEIFQSGVAIGELYGKIYEGGYIFYLNESTGAGMVASMNDMLSSSTQTTADVLRIGWTAEDPANPPLNYEPNIALRDSIIGAGINNTNIMVNTFFVPEPWGDPLELLAANACYDYIYDSYSDWFLPSKHELRAMYENLHVPDNGVTLSNNYWSSTHQYYAGSSFWSKSFYDSGAEYWYGTQIWQEVRAARWF